MRKKYYIKKKRKLVSSYKIIILLICILLLTSVGYSIFTTTLSLVGNVNLQKQTGGDLPTEISQSSATWEIKAAPWGDEYTTYNIQFELENKDEDIDTWVISMDFPPCVIFEDLEAWCVDSYEIEKVGDYDRITFYPASWNAELGLGETLSGVGFNIKLYGKTNMKIENLIFNNRLVTDFEQIGIIYDVEGNETEDKDNEIEENTIINDVIITNEILN